VSQVAFEHFPFPVWNSLVTRHCRQTQPESFDYGSPMGSKDLREEVARYPVVAAIGTVAVKYIPKTTVQAAAGPLKETAIVPVRPWPRIPTVRPTSPKSPTKLTNWPSPADGQKTVLSLLVPPPHVVP
jgi:hypothetical protein